MADIDTHGLIVDFGKHRGERWTRVPVSYLRWLANTAGLNGGNADIAKAELKRRGSTLPTIELSGHAIDRASTSCRRIWHETAKDENEGLYSWLVRIAQKALDSTEDGLQDHGEPGDFEVKYLGLKLVFSMGEYYPILKTVHPL